LKEDSKVDKRFGPSKTVGQTHVAWSPMASWKASRDDLDAWPDARSNETSAARPAFLIRSPGITVDPDVAQSRQSPRERHPANSTELSS
jgi:hypothetical protein